MNITMLSTALGRSFSNRTRHLTSSKARLNSISTSHPHARPSGTGLQSEMDTALWALVNKIAPSASTTNTCPNALVSTDTAEEPQQRLTSVHDVDESIFTIFTRDFKVCLWLTIRLVRSPLDRSKDLVTSCNRGSFAVRKRLSRGKDDSTVEHGVVSLPRFIHGED